MLETRKVIVVMARHTETLRTFLQMRPNESILRKAGIYTNIHITKYYYLVFTSVYIKYYLKHIFKCWNSCMIR